MLWQQFKPVHVSTMFPCLANRGNTVVATKQSDSEGVQFPCAAKWGNIVKTCASSNCCLV